MHMQSWCKTVGPGICDRRDVGSLVGGGLWVGARGDFRLPRSTSLTLRFFGRSFFFWRLAYFLYFGWGFVWKTAGGAPCRLRSEAWLAGSPVHARCPSLAMYIQQRWEVEAGLDTAWWSRMTGCAAVDGFSEEVEEKGPLRPGTRRVWCRCVL